MADPWKPKPGKWHENQEPYGPSIDRWIDDPAEAQEGSRKDSDNLWMEMYPMDNRHSRAMSLPPIAIAPGGRPPKYTEKATAREAKFYDFVRERKPGPRTTLIESIGNLIKSCLGGGIITIHVAYMECGIWTALALNFFLGFLVTYFTIVLTRTAQKAYGRTHTPAMSYPDLAEAVLDICPIAKFRKLSKCFRYLVDFTIVVDLFGSCCIYQLIIARQVIGIGLHFTEYDVNVRYMCAALLIPCILICWILSLKYLAPFSIVSDVILILVTGTTVYYALKNSADEDLPAFKNVNGLLVFLGVCVFSMEGIGAALPIENHMKKPRKIEMVVWSGMTIVVILIIISGFFGYHGFGEKSRSPVTLNFPYQGWTIFLKFGLVFTVYVSFGINFWIPFNLIWVYIKPRHQHSRHINCWERFYRALMVILITIVSTIFPNIARLMSVIGAICLTNMGFIYPALLDLLIDWRDPGLGVLKWRLLKFIFIFILSMGLMIVATINNIIELFKAVF